MLVSKFHKYDQTRPKRLSLKNVCKEGRLKEFQFKLIHRIVITRKELFMFGIKTDDECLYCGDKGFMSTLSLNARLRDPLQKGLYNGLMKPIVVRSPLSLRTLVWYHS